MARSADGSEEPQVYIDHNEGDSIIAVIESRAFLRECISRSMQSALALRCCTYSKFSELAPKLRDGSVQLIILSLMGNIDSESSKILDELSQLASGAPIIALADANDVQLARAAIRRGAKGFIPTTMGFGNAVEVMRFVLAGGTYAPPECILALEKLTPCAPAGLSWFKNLTNDELLVVQAILQGASNKSVARELNVSLNTVKTHVRSVMKKMGAKNH